MTINPFQKQIHISLVIFVLLLMGMEVSYSEINQNKKNEISSLVDLLLVPNRTAVTPGERIRVAMIVINKSPKPIFNLKVEYVENPIFNFKNKMEFPDRVDKYSALKRFCDFEAFKRGKTHLVITLLYNWKDDSGNIHSSVKEAITQELAVHSWHSEFGEKTFFLSIGAILTLLSGLISSIATLKFKTRIEKEKRTEEERKSKKEGEERVISILLSMLRINKKLIEKKNPLIRGWEDIYYKEGFYSTLYRISGTIKECDLPSIISDLFILFLDYEERLGESKQFITEQIQSNLIDRIGIITKSFEELIKRS